MVDSPRTYKSGKRPLWEHQAPCKSNQLHQQDCKNKEKLYQRLGREPSDEEILAEIDEITESDIKSFNINGNFEVSIDDQIKSDSQTEVKDFLIGDSYQRFEQDMNHQALKDELNELFDNLTEREKVILNMYFGLNNEEATTLRDIAERLELTNERVRQIKEDTLRRLRVFEKVLP